MRFSWILFCLSILFGGTAHAEGGCPPGQYPIGGQGVMACAPMPQQQQQQAPPRPSGEWIRTWGAVAVGVIDGIPRYGVPVGLASEDDAKQAAMARCIKSGAQNCRIATTFRNQCMGIGEPQRNGITTADGVLQFSRQSTEQDARDEALRTCVQENPGAECKVIHVACSEQVFHPFRQ